MSLRFSPEEALQKGWISAADAKLILSAGRSAQKVSRSKKARSSKRAEACREKLPQEVLFEALDARFPGRVSQERQGLVPGRNFRADIFIEPDVIVEMDGFAYHRSLDAFKSDRDRCNLLVAMGYRVFHAFNAQVRCSEQCARLVEIIACAVERRLPPVELCAKMPT